MTDNATVSPGKPAKPFSHSKLNWTGILLIVAGLGMFSAKFPPAYGKIIVEVAGWAVIILRTWYTDSAVKIGGSNNEKETEIMQGENTAALTGLGLNALIQGLVWLFGSRKTGMTGAQKFEHVVGQVLQQVAPAGVEIVANNQANPVTKAAIQTAVQDAHATLLANGEIQDTAALEAQPGPVAVPVITAPAQAPAAPASPSSPSPSA